MTTAQDGKTYNVTFYSLDVILAIGFRVRSKRGNQFRQWAKRNLKKFFWKGSVARKEYIYLAKGKIELAKDFDKPM